FLSEYIQDAIRSAKFLTDIRIHPLQIIHIEDLEHLEAVVANGTRFVDLLNRRESHAAWKNWPFSNFLFNQFSQGLPQNEHIVSKFRDLLWGAADQIVGQKIRGS